MPVTLKQELPPLVPMRGYDWYWTRWAALEAGDTFRFENGGPLYTKRGDLTFAPVLDNFDDGKDPIRKEIFSTDTAVQARKLARMTKEQQDYLDTVAARLVTVPKGWSVTAIKVLPPYPGFLGVWVKVVRIPLPQEFYYPMGHGGMETERRWNSLRLLVTCWGRGWVFNYWRVQRAETK